MADCLAHSTPSATVPDRQHEETFGSITLEQLQRWPEGHAAADAPEPAQREAFLPRAPRSREESRLRRAQLEAILLKQMLSYGDASGRELAEQMRLPFPIVEELLRELKRQQLVAHRSAAPLNDFQYQLTEAGLDRAKRHYNQCTYCGAAPVSIEDYVASVHAQSVRRQKVRAAKLRRALGDLVVNPKTFAQLGEALSAGRALFLWGAAGNGKTSMAERLTRVFHPGLWIPRAIHACGEIIRVFDPSVHQPLPLPDDPEVLSQIDHRWVLIHRPTITVGGELTMEELDIASNPQTGILEAPFQVKANGGTLVIDDFGRQRVGIRQLLNRWIVPLEKQYDFLRLPSGKRICVPLDQLTVFATNLDPRELVDEAFQRRIPYKVEVPDPDVEEFKELFRRQAPNFRVGYHPEAVDYLVEQHYEKAGRPRRYCHPRDLLLQVRHYCEFREMRPEMSPAAFDAAVANYFGIPQPEAPDSAAANHAK